MVLLNQEPYGFFPTLFIVMLDYYDTVSIEKYHVKDVGF